MQRLAQKFSPLGALVLAIALVGIGSPRAAEAQAGRAAANDAVTTLDELPAAPTAPEPDAERDRLRRLAEQFAPPTPEHDASAHTPMPPQAPATRGGEALGRPFASEQDDRPPREPGATSTASTDASPTLSEPLSPREQLRLGGSNDTPGDDSDNSAVGLSSGSWILNTLTALGLVIGLILLLRWCWSRVSGQPYATPSAIVEVLSRTAVAPRNHVLLLRVGGRILIVGDSQAGLHTLAEVRDEEEVAELLASVTASKDTSISRNFTHLLNRSFSDYETGEDPLEEGRDHHEHRFDRARDRVSSLLSRVRSLSGKGGA